MEVIRFALLGLATGALYALLAEGIVLVYRGSGLLNFAQGAQAMTGAYIDYELVVRIGINQVVGAIIAILLTGVLGALIHQVIFRRMRRSSSLSRVIATLGILVVLQSTAYLIYGYNTREVTSLLPTHIVHIFSSSLPIGLDRVLIFVICVVICAALYLVYRFTALGRITAAVSESELAAASFGYSPELVATVNWAAGSALAGLAGILIAPIIFLEPSSLVMLVIPAMSAALIGGFSSFPLTLAAALGIGVAESELERYVSAPGWPTAAPFLAALAVLILRGHALPLRGFLVDRLPTVGTGRVRPVPVVVAYAVGLYLLSMASPSWAAAAVVTLGFAIVCLSVVVVTGYAGQLSLAQYVLAGVGAFIAAKLAPHMTFVVAGLLAAIITALAGGLVAMTAVRVRGAALAVATLGLGGAAADVVLNNPGWTGGLAGLTVPVPHLFGWDMDPLLHPNRYAEFTLTMLVLACLAVANLRRSVTGRRLLAIRSNERAAASLGLPVAFLKLYAFMVSAALAAIGGVLIAFQQSSIQLSTFDVFTCVLVVAVTVAGGVGYIPGALLGSLMISGGLVSQLFSSSPTVNNYLPLIGGVLLLLALIAAPDGLFILNRRQLGQLAGALGRVAGGRLSGLAVARPLTVRRARAAVEAPTRQTVPARALVVRDLSVSFGGVNALSEIDLEVRPGQVHGLIGPNGAGKTTFIDAVTGFVGARSGSVTIGDVDVRDWSPHRRAAAGLARSFQSLELFTDLSVSENLAVACQASNPLRALLDLALPSQMRLGSAARAAMHELELSGSADRRADQISFGERKLVAIARAIAAQPSLLLLDEPAAGLDDQEATELASLIRRLADDWGMGILLVEHKIEMIMGVSDYVTVLESGRRLAAGTPSQVAADPRVREAYIGAIGTGYEDLVPDTSPDRFPAPR